MSITDFKFELPKPSKPAKPPKPTKAKRAKTKPQYTYPKPHEIPEGWEAHWGGPGVGWIVGLR